MLIKILVAHLHIIYLPKGTNFFLGFQKDCNEMQSCEEGNTNHSHDHLNSIVFGRHRDPLELRT